jgi:O-antigen ligase
LIALVSLIPAYFRFGLTAVEVGGLYLLRFAIYASLFWTVQKLFKPSQIGKVITVLGLTLVITGLGQYLLLPDVRFLKILGWDDHYYRVVGTLLDPGFMGIMLVLFLVFLSEYKDRAHKLLWVVTYISLLLTYSRSSYLAYLVAMTFVAYKNKSIKFLLITWTILILSVPILPRASSGEGVKLERTSSIQARLDNWRNSLFIIKDNPITGVGFNTYRYAQKQYGFISDSDWQTTHAGAGADSSLLFVGATTGLIGLMCYLLYLSTLWKYEKMRPALLAILVHSWFLNSLFYPFVLVFLALFMANSLPSAPSETGSPKRRLQ